MVTSILFLVETIYSNIQFWSFWKKKRSPSLLMYFRTYGLRNMWLDKCLKIQVSKDSFTRSMVNGSKLCWNLNNSTFTIFINSCEGTRWKSLSEWYGKPQAFSWTHWLPIASVLFLTEIIYSNIFRFNYFRQAKYFLIFFWILWI